MKSRKIPEFIEKKIVELSHRKRGITIRIGVILVTEVNLGSEGAGFVSGSVRKIGNLH